MIKTLKLIFIAGKITITETNCQDVFIVANMLQLHGVIEACITFLTQQLHPCNAIGTLYEIDTKCLYSLI